MPAFRPIQFFHTAMAAALVSVFTNSASAQGHSDTRGAFTLHASTVSSLDIPSDQASQAGIERGPNFAVLNVVIRQKQPPADTRTVTADVTARVTSLSGRAQNVTMKQNTDNHHVSYLGVYTVVPNEVVDIVVTAKPEGASAPIELQFRGQHRSARPD